jgi:hypothetical protein
MCTVRAIFRPFRVYYLLAGVEFAFGGWALYVILTKPGSEFPTVGAFLLGVGMVSLFFAIRSHRWDRLRRRLLATGDRGTAKILRLVQTGTSQNYVPLFRITLRITADVHGTYEKTLKAYLTNDKIGVARPGSTVAVKVDHDDREQVTIDWSALPTTWS